MLAAASGSASGDSIFKSVSVVDGYLVIVLNTTPDKVYRLPLEADFRIAVGADEVAIIAGTTVEIPFEVVGADATTRVFAEAYGGYEAVLKDGVVAITAPEELPADGYVIIKAIRNSDSAYKAVCISFEAGEFAAVADVEEVSKDGGDVVVTVVTNLEYEVTIPAEAASWIHVAPQTRAVRTDAVALKVDANEGMRRSATVAIVPSLGASKEIRIIQYGAEEVIFEEVDLASVAGFVICGSAVQAPVAMEQTIENEDVFAFYADLKSGYMYIDMKDAGNASMGAIVPSDGTGINAGQASAFVQDFVEFTDTEHWVIPADGKYRIVLDRASKVITIYDEATDLQPVRVEYWYAGQADTWRIAKTLLSGTYYINTMTGWDSWKGKAFEFSQSPADPQVLVCKAPGLVSGSICIKVAQNVSEVEILQEGTGTGKDNPNEAGAMDFISKTLAFVPASEPGVELNADTDLVEGEWLPMAMAVSNKKWKPEGGSIALGLIIVDMRNNLIRFEKSE